MYTHLIIHYAELALKGENRDFFEGKLISNIRDALSDCTFSSIKKIYGRFIITLDPESDIENIKFALLKVCGISYFCFALHSKSIDVDSIKGPLLEIATGIGKETTFRVSAKKSIKLDTSSTEFNVALGQAIVDTFSAKVKLKDPEVDFVVEVTEQGAFLYKERFEGIGGLPVGVTGKLVCLISGGIDSPVAAFKMFTRGCRVVFVHFFNHTPNKKSVRDKVEQLVSKLSEYQGQAKLFLVPFEELQREIITNVSSKYRMIVYRRFMFRIAERILTKEGAKGFITGDSLAQVASQTLENIGVVYEAARYPVFAPLIGSSKQEIIDLATKIGTYDTSILPYSDCCSFLISEHPETRAKLLEIEEVEKKLDIDGMIEKAIGKLEIKRI